jgi:hypothetical protein
MRRRPLSLDGFEARLDGVEALRAAINPKTAHPDRMRTAADAIDVVTPAFEHVGAAVAYSAFAEVLRQGALLAEWRAGVLAASPDADRYLRAAKARRSLWLAEAPTQAAAADLIERTTGIDTLEDVGMVSGLLTGMAATALPIGVISTEYRPRIPLGEPDRADDEPAEPKGELAVAFVKFALDGAPAANIHFLSAGQAHDVDIEVRVSRWPAQAETLELRPYTIEQPGTYEFPVFQLARPSGDPPYLIRQQGRAILKYAQGLNARPYEFRYSAHFTLGSVEQPVAVVGQRTLRIDGVDLKQHSLTGYPRLDAKIVELREDIRSRPRVSQDELADALTVVIPLAKFAGQALQDNLVDEIWSEARLQAAVRGKLRDDPAIGAALEEHPAAAGGITDLSFRGIRIELKVERDKRLELEDCQAYLGQTASYVVASGKRLGVLCVLDCSPKRDAPFPAEDGIGVFVMGAGRAPVHVIVMLVQGNLARPSSLSP